LVTISSPKASGKVPAVLKEFSFDEEIVRNRYEPIALYG
jgi:hypothetical protein